MLFPIKQLIEGRGKPVCVTRETKISSALAIMFKNDFSQLPIVDKDEYLQGIVTEKSVISTYFHTSGNVSLLDLSVDNCMTTAKTISPESDIFEALDLLEDVYAIVVIKDNKPVGILTDYDTTKFFRDISGGLILVEDIEVTLRQYIENIYSNENALKAALVRAFGQDKRISNEPAQQYNDLTLGGYISLITTEKNWENFEEYFKPKELFTELIKQVLQIRNQLAHFRGRLDSIQHNALVRARDWIATRPKFTTTLEVQSINHFHVVDTVVLNVDDKYSPLHEWLINAKSRFNNVKMGFYEIEKILGEPLPPSAKRHRSWWDNDYIANPQSLAWLKAGWSIKDVDFSSEEVTFLQSKHVLMQLFFADVLEYLKKARPGITSARKTQPQNWWSFGAGRSGFSIGWVFTGHKTLRVELYIDTGNKKYNKVSFDRLIEHKNAIENEIGCQLTWDRLDSNRASRISSEIPLTIYSPYKELDEAKVWVLETTLKFIDALQPRLKRLVFDL
jgi:hypothetical protein